MKKILLMILLFTLLACENKKEDLEMENETIQTEEYIPLQKSLDEKKSNFELNAEDEKKKDYAAGIQAIVDDGVLERAMNEGDKAPNFTLKNAKGENVTLYEELENGPVVLIWYRGGWCPYCNLTLKRLQNELPNFKKYDASLIALTPELPDSSLSTVEKNEISYQVLSDIGNKVAKDYGVVFELTDAVAKRYQDGFNLHQYNGDESNTLPLAATYVIDKSGQIVYAFLDADYRNRAEPKDILNSLKNIK
jgi:peroxiredoxin